MRGGVNTDDTEPVNPAKNCRRVLCVETAFEAAAIPTTCRLAKSTPNINFFTKTATFVGVVVLVFSGGGGVGRGGGAGVGRVVSVPGGGGACMAGVQGRGSVAGVERVAGLGGRGEGVGTEWLTHFLLNLRKVDIRGTFC